MSTDMRDLPINSSNSDLLNIDKYADALVKFILNSNTPVTISLQGEWGSGKTSLMNLINAKICNESSDNRFESIWINTWEFFINDSDEEAIEKVILAVIKKIIEIGKEKTDGYENEIKEVMSNLKRFAVNSVNLVMSMGGVDEKARKSTIQMIDSNRITIIKYLRNSIENLVDKLVKENNRVSEKGFIFFIDDLDRIEPELAIKILEIFKNIFDINNCVFVLAVDYEVIVKGLKRKYGEYSHEDDFNFRAYFDKLIQLPFVMPVNTYDTKRLIIDSLYEIAYFKQDEKLSHTQINHILNGVRFSVGNNPRRIKRMINAISLSKILDDSNYMRLCNKKNKIINLLLICIQQSYPQIYNRLCKNADYTLWVNENKDIKNSIESDMKWNEVLYEICVNEPGLKNRANGICKLFCIMDEILEGTPSKGDIIQRILSLSALTNMSYSYDTEVLYDGNAYESSSQTQFKQGNKLVDRINCKEYSYVLDIGCGNGKTTLEFIEKNPTIKIDAFDLSHSQIDVGIRNRDENKNIKEKINFFVMDAMDLNASEKYDLVFSNASLHWILDSISMYNKIYNCLKQGGEMAIHQGGYNCYKGLHDMVRKAISNLNLECYYENWNYPIFYPTKEYMEKMLLDIGFKQVKVISEESDGMEYSNLVDNFANASLLPYFDRIPNKYINQLKDEYFRICKLEEVDTYTHRLYVFGIKGDK